MGSSRPRRGGALPNYIRAERKRLGLSQDEVAFLLNCRHGGKVSRYERFQRVPNLETAAALELIFGVPAHELFAGVYEEAERLVGRRTRTLARRLARRAETKAKLARLQAITNRIKGTEEYRYETLR
jgi:transcriptional regulator with XRE-family HTH domain